MQTCLVENRASRRPPVSEQGAVHVERVVPAVLKCVSAPHPEELTSDFARVPKRELLRVIGTVIDSHNHEVVGERRPERAVEARERPPRVDRGEVALRAPFIRGEKMRPVHDERPSHGGSPMRSTEVGLFRFERPESADHFVPIEAERVEREVVSTSPRRDVDDPRRRAPQLGRVLALNDLELSDREHGDRAAHVTEHPFREVGSIHQDALGLPVERTHGRSLRPEGGGPPVAAVPAVAPGTSWASSTNCLDSSGNRWISSLSITYETFDLVVSMSGASTRTIRGSSSMAASPIVKSNSTVRPMTSRTSWRVVDRRPIRSAVMSYRPGGSPRSRYRPAAELFAP